MFSRRHLRIRVMQALYAWYQTDDRDLGVTLRELSRGAERTYDLYLSLLQILPELADQETRYYTDLQPRHIKKDTPLLSRFSGNAFVRFLTQDSVFSAGLLKRKITWQKEDDLVRKLFNQLRATTQYLAYVAEKEHTEEQDVEFCTWIFKELIMTSEPLQNTLEEQNIWWAEALEMVNSMVLKTIRVSHPGKKGAFELMPMFRDEEDDRIFMDMLFRETIQNEDRFEKLISEKTRNWEVERIALMDIILLKMALCEILCLPGVPIKVSINEYIDISKTYSTPKSKVFINGIIDNLVIDLKAKGEIKKTGRGLIE